MLSIEKVYKASQNIKGIVERTPLVYMKNFSEKYQAFGLYEEFFRKIPSRNLF